ncbi:MAG TPA: zinc-ribbon domain-containing protein [Rhodospirillales bacterium]
MIITCQNCHTHYSVDGRAIGGGKTVRCGNCGNSWLQRPVRSPAPRMAPQPMPYPPQPMPYPQQYPYPPMPYPPQPMPYPPQQAAYAPQAAYGPPPQPAAHPAPMPEPEPMPMPEPEPMPELEATPEPMPEPEAAPESTAESMAAAGADGDGLSPQQLDEMFGDEPEPTSIQPLTDAGEPENVEDMAALDQLPEPEPIPQVFSAETEESAEGGADEGKSRKGMIAAIAAAVLLIALGGGLFFGRGAITGMWPGAAKIYAMVGLGAGEIGAGLDIRDVKSAREVQNGVDVLVVSGTVANVSEDERQVPMIRVALYDGNNVEVQHAVAAPLKNRLPGGANIAFRAQLAEPSALARRLEVTFTKETKAEAKK